MMLIKHTLNNLTFPEEDCTDHAMKYPYAKKRGPTPAQPSEPSDTFMADTRGRGAHGRTAHAPSVAREVKQLNWFQRNILCMNVEIHKEQYQAHLERKQIAHNQALIIHRLRNTQKPPLAQNSLVPYKTWTGTSVDWLEIEKQLNMAPSGSSAQPTQDDDGDNSEDTFNYESEDDPEE